MKSLKSLFICMLLFSGFGVLGQQSDALSNETIIGMYAKGLPASIITSRLKTAKNTFDTSTEALIKLTENKIPEDIINAMIDAAGDASRHFAKIDPNNPTDMHESGIYYFKKSGGSAEIVPLEPTVYSQSKSGGALASALSYGIAKVKVGVTLDGTSSRMQIDEQQPVFYFYFDITKNSLSQTSNWWFSTATSPNEFILVDFTVKKKSRDVETGSASILGASSGVADKNKIPFKSDRIAPGIYKVYFDRPIKGEFCFMYAGSVPTGFTVVNKVYDFGVK
jgi:hypothetical protein